MKTHLRRGNIDALLVLKLLAVLAAELELPLFSMHSPSTCDVRCWNFITIPASCFILHNFVKSWPVDASRAKFCKKDCLLPSSGL